MGIFSKNKTTESPVDPAGTASSSPAVVSDQQETKTFVSSSVILRPIVTEKSAILASQNAYVFAVTNRSNKIDVAQAIRSLYGVIPTQVNVVNVRGKTVRRGKIVGKRKSWKKAVVILPKGKTINLYEGV